MLDREPGLHIDAIRGAALTLDEKVRAVALMAARSKPPLTKLLRQLNTFIDERRRNQVLYMTMEIAKQNKRDVERKAETASSQSKGQDNGFFKGHRVSPKAKAHPRFHNVT